MNALRPARPTLPLVLAAIIVAATLWSGIGPEDRATWWAEVAPVLLALPLMAATWRRFPLTPPVYVLVALHAVTRVVGGRYTCAQVPLRFWMQAWFDFTRNHYDRIGHFVQGFVPAIAARETLLRRSPLTRGGWLFFVVCCVCLSMRACYELIVWAAAASAGQGAAAFLGTQGDEWAAQKDLLLALIGAITTQLALADLHDRQLALLAGRRP